MIKPKIEENARKIWQFLNENQISSVIEIEKNLLMQRRDILMALGWLARDEKVFFLDDRNDSKIMFLEDINED